MTEEIELTASIEELSASDGSPIGDRELIVNGYDAEELEQAILSRLRSVYYELSFYAKNEEGVYFGKGFCKECMQDVDIAVTFLQKVSTVYTMPEQILFDTP